jgi:hypothetical protein
MSRHVEQGVHLGHRHRIRPGSDLDDLIPGPHHVLAQHPQVEPGPVMGDGKTMSAQPYLKLGDQKKIRTLDRLRCCLPQQSPNVLFNEMTP